MTNRTAAVYLTATGENIDAAVEDFHPYEPAAYCTDPGWDAYAPDGREFYLSISGDTYLGNTHVGTHSLGHPEL